VSTEISPTSFRLNAERLHKIDALMVKFAPFTTKRSHVINLAIDVLHVIVSTQGTVQVVVEWLQCLLRTTSYAQRAEFPAEVSPTAGEAGSVDGLGRPRSISLLSRRAGLFGSPADVETATYSASFLRLRLTCVRSLAS
jgi:hypothetical protein